MDMEYNLVYNWVVGKVTLDNWVVTLDNWLVGKMDNWVDNYLVDMDMDMELDMDMDMCSWLVWCVCVPLS